MITVTEVTLYPLKNPQENSSLRAFAQITLNDSFVVKGIRVVEGQKGMFIGFPQQKGKDDQYHDQCFPITKEARNHISDSVLEKYAESAAEGGQVPAPTGEGAHEPNSEW